MVCQDCKKKEKCAYKLKVMTKGYCELKKQSLLGKVKKAISKIIGG